LYAPEEKDEEPAGQRLQEKALNLFDHDPAGHDRQFSEPDTLYVPNPHLWHADLSLDPETLLKVPAGHGALSDSEMTPDEGP
jgi:hypothetical protein